MRGRGREGGSEGGREANSDHEIADSNQGHDLDRPIPLNAKIASSVTPPA